MRPYNRPSTSNFPDMSRAISVEYLHLSALELSCWNHLCLRARGKSSNSPGRAVSRKSRYRCSVIPSGSRQRPTKMSRTIPTQTRELKWILYPRSRLSRAQKCCGRWTHPRTQSTLRLSTECHVKRAHSRYVEVVSIRKIASAGDGPLGTDNRSASGGMDVIYRHTVRLVEIIQILMGFSQLFFHSYSHGISFRKYEYSYSPWATCILVCHSCYTSCLMETLLRSSKHDVDKDNAARIPAQQYQLDYYRYRELRACRIIPRVCIPWAFNRNWPFAVHCLEHI